MKTLKLTILFVAFGFCLNAQTVTGISKEEILKNDMVVSNIASIKVLNMFSLMAEPQMGGLFDASYRYVIGIANFKNYFETYDLGIKLGFLFSKIKNLRIASGYNIGLLKFNSFGPVPGEVFKMSISYNF